MCYDWSQIIKIKIKILKNEEEVALIEGLVVIYGPVREEFWKITRFLKGARRRISLRQQSMREEDCKNN